MAAIDKRQRLHDGGGWLDVFKMMAPGWLFPGPLAGCFSIGDDLDTRATLRVVCSDLRDYIDERRKTIVVAARQDTLHMHAITSNWCPFGAIVEVEVAALAGALVNNACKYAQAAERVGNLLGRTGSRCVRLVLDNKYVFGDGNSEYNFLTGGFFKALTHVLSKRKADASKVDSLVIVDISSFEFEYSDMPSEADLGGLLLALPNIESLHMHEVYHRGIVGSCLGVLASPKLGRGKPLARLAVTGRGSFCMDAIPPGSVATFTSHVRRLCARYRITVPGMSVVQLDTARRANALAYAEDSSQYAEFLAVRGLHHWFGYRNRQ